MSRVPPLAVLPSFKVVEYIMVVEHILLGFGSGPVITPGDPFPL